MTELYKHIEIFGKLPIIWLHLYCKTAINTERCLRTFNTSFITDRNKTRLPTAASISNSNPILGILSVTAIPPFINNKLTVNKIICIRLAQSPKPPSCLYLCKSITLKTFLLLLIIKDDKTNKWVLGLYLNHFYSHLSVHNNKAKV